MSRRVVDPQLHESESRRLSDSPTCRLGELSTRRVGELVSIYEYLREFEAKIGTARNVVKGTYAEPISAKKKQKILLIAMFL